MCGHIDFPNILIISSDDRTHDVIYIFKMKQENRVLNLRKPSENSLTQRNATT